MPNEDENQLRREKCIAWARRWLDKDDNFQLFGHLLDATPGEDLKDHIAEQIGLARWASFGNGLLQFCFCLDDVDFEISDQMLIALLIEIDSDKN